ncbi:MAG: HlyD family efflux transporter periplasmic adaptor subunit, partial [Chloroflexaceae bacterium]|nr:HlyD family efflux transporter periplasmic adaptor subunit [Chloroflexaceae bacterium]
MQVEQARASLAQARATYEQLIAGATSEEIERAEAQLVQAQAQFQQTQGSITSEDVAAARAQLTEAQARLQVLEAGTEQTDIDTARASLARARTNLQAQRDALAASKVQAQSQMEQAANVLRSRQTEYSNIYWDNREIERQNGGGFDSLAQSLRDREEEALRVVENAEADLDQARVAYEQAQQAEITGIQIAEAEVVQAQASLDALLEPADPDDIAAARAQVAQAQANLTRLVGQERAGSLAAASAAIASAQANLDQLTAAPRDVDLAGALAQIRQAEVTLEQTEIDVLKATLRAPIAGTLAEINLKIAEAPDATLPDMVLADLSSFDVDVTVDEIDVAQLAIGQPVQLTLDALPELPLEGEVEMISPLSSELSA